MALTRSSAREQVKYRLGNRTDLSDTFLDVRLSRASTELASRLVVESLRDIDSSKTFTAASDTLAFPTDFVAITHIYNTTKDRPLRGPIEWLRLRDIQKSSGEPRVWAVRNFTIYFDHKADAADALSIAGQTRPTWTTGDSATPDIAEEYEYGILLLATLYTARDIGMHEVADRIEDPRTGRGQFKAWADMNNFPDITQDLQPPADGLRVNLTGYSVVE